MRYDRWPLQDYASVKIVLIKGPGQIRDVMEVFGPRRLERAERIIQQLNACLSKGVTI